LVTDLLRFAINYALSKGARYAETRYHLNSETSIILRNDRVISAGITQRRGIGIRVMYDGVLSFTSTSILSKDSIREAVDKAILYARTFTNRVKAKRGLGEAKFGRAKYEAIALKDFDSKPMDVKISELKELWKIINKSVKESKVASFAVIYSELCEVKELMTSDGAWIQSKIPRVRTMINFVLAHPQRGTAQRILDFGESGGLELVEKWRMNEVLEEEAKAVERVLLKGVEPPKEPIDVIIGSEVVGLIVHESAGHPMEADRIWGREAAQAGESYVKMDMIGKERIGNEHATVIDDPTIPGSFGFYLYDDEGVPARARYLYYKGLINEPLHNRWTAYIYGVESNAAARATDYASEPIPRMSTTYLEPGDMSFEELIEDVKLGVYIKNYMEWNIDDIRWGQRYVGLEAYMIRNGEIGEPVRNPVLEITTKAFYSLITGKTKDLRFHPGICGKGEPSQPVPVWHGGPDVKLSKIRLGVAPR